MKRRRDVVNLKVRANDASKSWLSEMNWRQRGIQMESLFLPEAGIQLAGCGDRISNDRRLIEITITFAFRELQQACSEFQRMAKLLKFPPGTRLTAITYDDQGNSQFTDLAEW